MGKSYKSAYAAAYAAAYLSTALPWAAGAALPALVFDFDDEYYRTSNSKTTFESAISHNSTTATNGTMVDSDGLLKWRPHNLLTYSEQFESAWTRTGILAFGSGSVTNAAVSPDGTLTADKIIEDSSSSVHRIEKSVTVTNGANYSAYIYFKPSGRTRLLFRVYDGAANLGVAFNSDGTANDIEGSPTKIIEDVGNGWLKCGIVFMAQATSIFYRIGPLDSGSNIIYQGDGTSGIYVWGAHLYRSDLGGMVNNPDRGDSYVPTTSAAVYLPRRGHHVYNGSTYVNEGLLVESQARTNLLTYSHDLSNGFYASLNSTFTGSQENPLTGESFAFLVESSGGGTGSSGFTLTSQSISVVSGGKYTWSTLVKASGSSWVLLLATDFDATQSAYFDISNGVVGTSTADDAFIQDVGGGVYRCSIVFSSVSDLAGRVRLYAADDDGDATVSLDGSASFFYYGGQVEQGSTPSSYIPTNGATATRGAETLTVAAADLPWPTPRVIGPELVTNGGFDDGTTGFTDLQIASIANVSGEGVLTSTSNGSFYVDVQISTVIGSVYRITADFTAVSLSAGGVYFLIRNSAKSNVYSLETSGGVETQDHIFVATDTTHYIRIGGGSSSLTGDTITFDNISVREIDPLSVSIQMDGRMTYADTNTLEAVFWRWYVSSSNRMSSDLRTSGSLTGQPYFYQAANGTFDDADGSIDAYSPGILVPYNIASRHGSTFINGAVSGTALTADTTPTALPDLSSTNLQLAYDYNGTIKTFRMWAKDLTDAGLEEATS